MPRQSITARRSATTGTGTPPCRRVRSRRTTCAWNGHGNHAPDQGHSPPTSGYGPDSALRGGQKQATAEPPRRKGHSPPASGYDPNPALRGASNPAMIPNPRARAAGLAPQFTSPPVAEQARKLASSAPLPARSFVRWWPWPGAPWRFQTQDHGEDPPGCGAWPPQSISPPVVKAGAGALFTP